MGKGDRKNRKSIGVPLAPVPKREKHGKSTRRKRTVALARERDPSRVALEARARQMGVADWKAMRAQYFGEPAGQAIYLYVEQSDTEGEKKAAKASAMWSTYAGATNSYRRFMRTCMGVSPDAKVAKMEYLPESFEVDPEDEPDLRDEDEKHRDAANGWDHWLTHIHQLSIADQSIIQSVSRGWHDELIDAELTSKWKHFAQAIERLSERVD